MERDPSVARQLWRRLEVIHAVTYFSPEAIGALADAGYKGFWMGYFAGRAAPLGAVGPEVVGALFYNFLPARVSRALPDAWALAAPEAALTARSTGSVAALERLLGATGDDQLGEAVATAAPLARRAAEVAPPEGRALFAANGALDWPGEPLAVLWHAATLLREQRGDGHVATLVAAGISGRESHVLQAAGGATTRAVLTPARDFTDDEWSAVSAGLVDRGLVADDGSLTTEGRALKDDIEARTDRVALSAYAILDDDEARLLLDALTPVARAVVDGGGLPGTNPIGVDLDAG